MKLSTSLVAVKKINSKVSRSNFAEDDLEKSAQLIIEAEGIINPIVLRRISLDSYEVVDGDFEYYAAATAREIDPRIGEKIGAFIIDEENEEAIIEQIKLLRKSSKISSNSDESEVRLTRIETRFENRIDKFEKAQNNEVQKINERLKILESRIPQPIEPLEALNNLSLAELVSKLKRVGINSKIIENIVHEREPHKFTSFSNVVERVKGLGDKTMIKIIDSFSEFI